MPDYANLPVTRDMFLTPSTVLKLTSQSNNCQISAKFYLLFAAKFSNIVSRFKKPSFAKESWTKNSGIRRQYSTTDTIYWTTIEASTTLQRTIPKNPTVMTVMLSALRQPQPRRAWRRSQREWFEWHGRAYKQNSNVQSQFPKRIISMIDSKWHKGINLCFNKKPNTNNWALTPSCSLISRHSWVFTMSVAYCGRITFVRPSDPNTYKNTKTTKAFRKHSNNNKINSLGNF